jgi:antitoxin YokJ
VCALLQPLLGHVAQSEEIERTYREVVAVEHVLEKIANTAGCSLLPPKGMPTFGAKYRLPDDLTRFYELCGGAMLFQQKDYHALIVPPDRVVPANPVIVGQEYADDITASWHIIADDGNGDYLTIDLHPERLGRCYDSFHETHGLVGDCPIIARSFSELLHRLHENAGAHWYWLRPGFVPIGDAYDDA